MSFSEIGYFRGAEFGKENQGSCRAKLHLKQPFQIVQEAAGGQCSLRPGLERREACGQA